MCSKYKSESLLKKYLIRGKEESGFYNNQKWKKGFFWFIQWIYFSNAAYLVVYRIILVLKWVLWENWVEVKFKGHVDYTLISLTV